MFWTYIFVAGCLMGAVGVGFGAFGAHALKEMVPPADLQIWETGVRYWMYHTLGVLVISLMMTKIDNLAIKTGGVLMIVGSLVFSSSLLTLVWTGQRWLGAITPIGGVLLIVAWLLAASSVFL